MTTLYRRYRPDSFADISGQPQVTEPLEKAIKTGKVAHAYLLHGPRGTGKTTTARVLAKTLQCEAPNLIEIDAASNRGIDDIRALQEGISTRPTAGNYKIYIIDEVHMLTKEAFTALLKTLEEPVAHAIFVLATTELHKVPATIMSRCQVFRFRRGTAEEISARLKSILEKERREANDEAIQFIVDRSDGCYRDAESLLGQALSSTDGEVSAESLSSLLGLPAPAIISNWLNALLAGNAQDALQTIDEAIAQGFDPESLLAETIRTARDQALEKAKVSGGDATYQEIIRALIQAQQDLAFVPQPQIALHLAVLTLCVHNKQPTPQPQKQPVAMATPAAAQAAPATPKSKPAKTISSEISKLWPEVISAMKLENPVASTFLRAMEPGALGEKELTVTAKYGLHHTFFAKPENLKQLTKIVSEKVGREVEVKIAQDFAHQPVATKPQTATSQPIQAQQPGTQTQPASEQTASLLDTVQEVFGDKAQA